MKGLGAQQGESGRSQGGVAPAQEEAAVLAPALNSECASAKRAEWWRVQEGQEGRWEAGFSKSGCRCPRATALDIQVRLRARGSWSGVRRETGGGHQDGSMAQVQQS